MPQVAAWGEANKPRVLEFLALLDQELAHRRFAAGDQYSVADITGLIALDFMQGGQAVGPGGIHPCGRWHVELGVTAERQGMIRCLVLSLCKNCLFADAITPHPNAAVRHTNL